MSTPAFTSAAAIGHFIGGEHAVHPDARTQSVFPGHRFEPGHRAQHARPS